MKPKSKNKTEKAALGNIFEGSCLFVITYYISYISASATHGLYLTAKFHSTFSRAQASTVLPERDGDICPLILHSWYHTNP